MHIRDTSGQWVKRPPRLKTLVQRELVNLNKVGIEVGVEELDRSKLGIPEVGQEEDEPRRRRDESICKQTRDGKVWWRTEQTNNAFYRHRELRECMAAALEKGGPVWLLEVLIQASRRRP